MADEIKDDVVNDDTTNETLNAEDGVEALKARLAESDRLRLAAEARATSAEARVEQAQDTVTSSELSIIEGGIQQLATNKEILKANYATAMSEGNFALASEINAEMAKNAAQLLNLENGKIAIETRPKREERRTAIQSNDPVEVLASQLAPQSAAWIRQHPEYARDPKKNAKMMGAHYKALAEELAPNSPEYFAFVEKDLGIGHSDQRRSQQDDTDDGGSAIISRAATGTQRRQGDEPPPAAPGRNGGGGGSKTVRLTPAQAEAAKISGLSPEEYHASLQKVRNDPRNKPN